ncbi:MAG: hypothetical protein HYZ53_25135 [Planctomycetes bacterium]|nr:hypothetical protein [Planctomycetota bacterium]
MRYYKTAQYVPGKGDAWMYYECDDRDLVQRYVTHIPATNETDKVSAPVVQTVFRPDTLLPIEAKEFLERWKL